MTLLLTMTESDSSIISGVPEYVEFETNEPATVFYTVDGTGPDAADLIAVGKVYLPTHGQAFTLSAVAISGSEESDILEEDYSTDSSALARTRNVSGEGIVILPAGEYDNFVDHLSEDTNGQESQRTTIEFLDLMIITSTTNSLGEPLASGSLSTETTHDFINIPDRSGGTEIPDISSVHDSDFFPNAKVIVIDGSTEALLDSQAVRIINRPHGTIDPSSSFYNDHIIERPLVSGNFVRAMYNPKTGKAVFYYRESRDNRWIKSVQSVQPKCIKAESKPGFVFKWIESRSMSKIY
jgi:hypothetical protein